MTRRRVLLAGAACLLAVVVGRAAAEMWPSPPEPHVQPPSAQAVPATAEQRNEAGAVRAALTHLQVVGSADIFDPQRRERLLSSAGVPEEARERFAAGYDLAADALGLDEKGESTQGELVSRTVPVGHRLAQYDGERAVVEVWAVGLLGVAGPTSTLPVQASWSTETLTLEWGGSSWRWTALEHQDGPAPVGSAQVPAAQELILRQVREFQEARHDG
jgi:hypothetical protein